MQTTAADREDLSRLPDDDRPGLPDGTGDPELHDLSELWCDLGGS